jgi:hypothetical protein
MALGRRKKRTDAPPRFWEAAPRRGRPPKYTDPQRLWEDCVEYFEWVEDNPLKEDGVYAYQGNIKHEPKAKMRAMTTNGLCIFLGIVHDTWIDWRNNRPEFSEVITRVEGIIRAQKFEGAAAELLNANIIARDLGLIEKQAHDHSGSIDIGGAKNELADQLARTITASAAAAGTAEGTADPK